MSGHSKWSKVKHQKAVTDVRKGKVFSKISRLITVAAQKGSDPDTNPALRDAVTQAKTANMPVGNIEKAIKRGAGKSQEDNLEEVFYEAFGPGGTAILIEGITDNKNRTLSEIKHVLSVHNAKLATPGSARWKIKHLINLSETDKESLKKLIEALKEHDDIQKVRTNSDTGN